MKKIRPCIINFVILIFILCLQWGLPLPVLAEEVEVDNLQNSAVGGFPEGWKTYLFHYGKAHKVYVVQQDNNIKFIRAEDSQDISVPIFKDFDWQIEKYPYLKFRWRAQKLPAGARESSPATNDSACGVYVGFGMTSALKYVWSTSFPVGSYWQKNPGKFYIISREVGPTFVGQWKSETIRVSEDYKMYFHKDAMKTPAGIGLLTDGNAVHQPSACDYADFRISDQP
jgi:DUF3047 family protein